MRLVVDANIMLSALITDSMTRRLIVTGDDELLAPAYIHEEVTRYVPMVADKTDRNPAAIEELAERFYVHHCCSPRNGTKPAPRSSTSNARH